MKKLLILIIPLCVLMLQSCNGWQALRVTKEIVENYPSDNPIESVCEDVLKSQTGIDVDFSFWDDNEDKGWIKDSKVDCSCGST